MKLFFNFLNIIIFNATDDFHFTIQVTPRDIEVDDGGRLELRCHVSGQPVDAVTWYKNGIALR